MVRGPVHALQASRLAGPGPSVCSCPPAEAGSLQAVRPRLVHAAHPPGTDAAQRSQIEEHQPPKQQQQQQQKPVQQRQEQLASLQDGSKVTWGRVQLEGHTSTHSLPQPADSVPLAAPPAPTAVRATAAFHPGLPSTLRPPACPLCSPRPAWTATTAPTGRGPYVCARPAGGSICRAHMH